MVPAVIQTSSVNSDYDCSILRSIREYDVGSDLMSQSLFRFQVLVEQIVYVDAKEGILTLQEVESIVETGFTRGQGGRVQFRSILMLHPAFRTVVNVEVLGSFPSFAPSINPSEISPIPSSPSPSNFPSVLSPWTSSPAGQPSASPSENLVTTAGPSWNPSGIPSSIVAHPASHRPPFTASLEPTALPVNPSTNEKALIVGSIIGGIALILAFLFFLFCIWFPFCLRQKCNDLNDPEDSLGAYPVPTSYSQTSTPNAVALPGILTLDDDMLSLANTTLDGKSSTQLFSSKLTAGSTHGQGTRPIDSNESFDDSSIYTSNTDPTNAAPNLIQSPPTAERISVANESISTKSQTVGSFSVVTLGTGQPQTKEFDPFDDEQEHFADDESPIGVGIATSVAASLGTSLQPDGCLPLLPTSSQSTDPATLLYAGDDAVSLSNTNYTPHAENSTLHEHFSKNAVVNAASNSLKSHSSLQSAPSRILQHGSEPKSHKSQVISSYGRPPPYGHRRIGTNQSISERSAAMSSRSVDEATRSRFFSSDTSTKLPISHKSRATNQSKYFLRKSISQSRDPLLDEFVGLQMPSTDASTAENDAGVNILQRKPLFEAVLRDETDAPAYSSGLFGASSRLSSTYDTSSESGRSGSWLLDMDESTLDSRKRVSEERSVSSRSSHSSKLSSFGRSLSSFALSEIGEQVSTEQIGNNIEQRSRADPGQVRLHSTHDFLTSTIVHEEKSAEIMHFPDSSHRTLFSIAGGTSSISGSSASRSTLSSKFDSYYERKYVEVFVPPGKINIVLADFRNGSGTIISEVRSSSALLGKLSPGDELGKRC
jgi:hypothetical protein